MLAAMPSTTPKTIRPTLLITRIPYSLSNILAVHHATPTKVVCRPPAVRWLMGPRKTGVGAGPDQVDTGGVGALSEPRGGNLFARRRDETFGAVHALAKWRRSHQSHD